MFLITYSYFLLAPYGGRGVYIILLPACPLRGTGGIGCFSLIFS